VRDIGPALTAQIAGCDAPRLDPPGDCTMRLFKATDRLRFGICAALLAPRLHLIDVATRQSGHPS